MFSCPCGRQFGSMAAMDQHQKDKGRANDTSFACHTSAAGTASGKPRHTWIRRDAWMRRDTRDREAIQTIDLKSLEPSTSTVSSTSACELLCTYNWQNCKGANIQVPGVAPVWQDVALPITIPKDEGTHFIDQNAEHIPQHPFEPLFRATSSMNPEFRFDDVDIVVNRNSLRKLLDLCAGRAQDSFRINLLLVRSSLFIERCEKNARELIRGSQNSGWGRNFERTFTRYHPGSGAGDSTGHHRVLRYPLGDLNCVVRFEVDACYEVVGEGGGEELAMSDQAAGTEDPNMPLTIKMGQLSMKDSTKEDTTCHATKSMSQTTLMPQSTTAEIKTTSKSKSLGSCLPQLWFGRTPWLIIGHHDHGTFNSVKITHAADHFEAWETERQTELRKLVTVLAQLRVAARSAGGNCIAIYERASKPPTIKIFASKWRRQALPDDLVREFWASEDPDEKPAVISRVVSASGTAGY